MDAFRALQVLFPAQTGSCCKSTASGFFLPSKTAKIFQKPLNTVNLIVHALFRHGYTLEIVAAEELIGESRKDYMMRNEKSLRSKQIYSDMPW